MDGRAIAAVLMLLASVTLGVFVGCMLTAGFVLVPYWRALPPDEFLAWYAANDRRLFGFFGVMTVLTLAVVLLAAAVAVWICAPGCKMMLAAAILIVATVAMFPLYFAHANASFAAGTIAPDAVGTELARWAWWHGVRTVVSAVALALATLAVWRARM
jgi:uncharacterized membrane protein